MSARGQGAINRANGNEPFNGFPIGSAANGLSVDPATFQIVLGNDVGLVTARLLSDRDIPFNGFTLNFVTPTTEIKLSQNFIRLSDFTANTDTVLNNKGQLQLDGDSSVLVDSPKIRWIDQNVLNPGKAWGARQEVTKLSFMDDNTTNHYLTLDYNFGIYEIGDIDTSLNGTKFRINDTTKNVSTVLDNVYDIINTAGKRFFFINQGSQSATLGDINTVATGAFFNVNYGIGYCLVSSPLGLGVNIAPNASPLAVVGLQAFANNAAAVAGGLIPGDFYRISTAGTSVVAVVE